MNIFNVEINDNIIDLIKTMPVVEKGVFNLDLKKPPPKDSLDIACNAKYIELPQQLKNATHESIHNAIHTNIKYSNCIAYPPNGGMDWHTNGDAPGIRIYASWSETGDSGMIWYKDNRIIIDYDTKGLNIRQFTTPCWHGVWSKCYRYSIGFRLFS
jgi:hypothetical protein